MKWFSPLGVFNMRGLPKKIVEVDLSGRIPEPPPWKPIVMDHIPEDPEEDRMTYVIMPMPEDPFEWIMKNLHNPSSWVAIYFVPTDFLDIEQVREDVRNFETRDCDRYFPDGYLIVGNRTVLDHCFNVVLPKKKGGVERVLME